MPQTFEFIEVKSSNVVVSENRRRIRSHAARAGYANDSPVNGDGPSRKNSGVNTILWPVAVELDVRVHVEQKTTIEAEKSTPTHPARDTGPVARPVGTEYILVPFGGNKTMLPISQSKLFPLPFLSLVLDNYLSHLAVAIPEVDGPTDTCLLKKSWFPMVLHSKILFQIIVLFSASHYALHNEDEAYHRDILLVKNCVIKDLREAISREGSLHKDEIVVAVGKLASYEAIFGTEEAYHLHMTALENMLTCRGGLSSLGLNGFLARLLVFIDTNSAFLLNTRLHLTESEFPRREPWIAPAPNPNRFLGTL